MNLDLIKEYPDLFANIDNKKMPIHHGCQCDEGWHDILDEAFSKISGRGLKLFQVKEKFGRLEIYLERGEIPEDVVQAIDEARTKSLKTCEICGKPGIVCKKADSSLIKTVCEDHQKEMGFIAWQSPFVR